MDISKFTPVLLYIAVFVVASYIVNPFFALVSVGGFHVGNKKSMEKENEVLNNANDKN
jgi:hypothetical protein